MSRPSSPFVNVDDFMGELTTTLEFSGATAAAKPPTRTELQLADIEARLGNIARRKREVEQAKAHVLQQQEGVTLPPLGDTAHGATAPRSNDILTEHDDDESGLLITPRPTDRVIQRASAMILTDESIASLMRRMRQTASGDGLVLPSEAEVEQYISSNVDLQRNAAAAYPDYSADNDPRLSDMVCSICLEVITDPAAVFDHVYDYDCIIEWLGTHERCPMSDRLITANDVRRNVKIKNMIEMIKDQGVEEVNEKRKQYMVLEATKRLLEQRASSPARGEGAPLVSELEQRLEQVKVTQQSLQAARAQSEESRQRYRSQLQRAEERRRQQQSENERLLLQLEHRDVASREAGATISESLRSLTAQLSCLDREHRDLSLQEEELIRERTDTMDLLRQLEEESRAKRLTVRAMMPATGSRCSKCWLSRKDQKLSSLHRCYRCNRSFCHSCCQTVGGIVFASRADDEENLGDDGEGQVGSGESLETVVVGPSVLRIYAWRRICHGCYLTCLRARMDSTTSTSATEDQLPFMYVLSQKEREAWRYLSTMSSLPRGLIEEWKYAPEKAAVILDDGIRTAQESLFPAVASFTNSVIESVRSQLNRMMQPEANPSDHE